MVEISARLCKDCRYCIKFCPKQILEVGQTRSRRGFFVPVLTDESKCIHCAICATVCPEGAIQVTEGERSDG